MDNIGMIAFLKQKWNCAFLISWLLITLSKNGRCVINTFSIILILYTPNWYPMYVVNTTCMGRAPSYCTVLWKIKLSNLQRSLGFELSLSISVLINVLKYNTHHYVEQVLDTRITSNDYKSDYWSPKEPDRNCNE